MKTYAFDFINHSAILAYATRKQATTVGNGKVLASDETELVKWQGATGAFVDLYNSQVAEDQRIKRFSDRPTAAKRLFALALAKAVDVEPTQESGEMVKKSGKTKEEVAAERAAVKAVKDAAKVEAKAAKEAAKAEAKTNGNGTRGRTSANAGKLIVKSDGWPAEGVPGREGSKRHNSFMIINENGEMSFEDYVTKGGSPGELKFGVFKNYIKVENATAE